jgi:hypothetical protein
MTITITSLKLKHWWGFFGLSLRGLKILRQTRLQKGFIEMKNTGFDYLHFTLSAWESAADARSFVRYCSQLEAMKASPKLAAGIRISTFQNERLPNWQDAKRLLFEHGRVISFADRRNSEKLSD